MTLTKIALGLTLVSGLVGCGYSDEQVALKSGPPTQDPSKRVKIYTDEGYEVRELAVADSANPLVPTHMLHEPVLAIDEIQSAAAELREQGTSPVLTGTVYKKVYFIGIDSLAADEFRGRFVLPLGVGWQPTVGQTFQRDVVKGGNVTEVKVQIRGLGG